MAITNNVTFSDSAKAIFGTGSDLQIYHTGTESWIKDAGTGNFYIDSNGAAIQLTANGAAENMLNAVPNGGITLYHNNAIKLATSSTGIDVTGVITTDGMTTSGNVDFGDLDMARFGVGNDLQIFHNGTANYIKNATSDQDLIIQGNDGGNIIDALIFDMSNAGAATFTGDVGIGTTSPSGAGWATNAKTLHIYQNDTAGSLIKLESSNTVGVINAANNSFQIATKDSDPISFYTNSEERFRIAADGSLSTPTAGTSNVRLGVNAGNSIVSGGNQNTVVGDEAGTAISTGDGNVAVGYGAFKTSNTGYHTVAIGVNAGDAIISAGQNVLIGYDSGTTLTTGGDNTAVGDRSFKLATTGTTNTAVGGTALENTSTGSANVAVGWGSLRANGTGSNNTAVGMGAGGSSTGTNNTFVGGLAGDAAETVSYSSLFGQDIACGDTSSNECNGFGYAITAASGYTTIGIGTYDIRAAHGNVTWATVSDERYKKDIVDSEAGLSLINALRPRTFKYKTLGELPETFNAFEADSTEVFKNSNTNHGFIAQEVKAAIDADDSIKDGFRLWDDRDDGSQEVAEAALIPVLVKAIQELTARIETLEG